MDEIQAQFGKEKINKISNLSNKEIKYSKINSDESINEKENIINNNINTNINKFSKEKPKYYFYLKIGHSYSFLGNGNSDPLIIIGPNYITFFYFIFGITLLFLCFFYSFWYYLNSFYQKLGISVYLIFLISYSHASLINQGYPKNILESKVMEEKNKFKWCNICKIWININRKSYHCKECDICIEGFDHHCPWITKCIGRRNVCTFYIFILSIFLIIFYLMIALFNVDMRKKRKYN